MKARRYSDSYKAGAVRLVKEQKRSISQTATELGISESALRRWVESYDVENGHKDGLTEAEKAEIRVLKREVQVLKMEREILKKSLGFFAKENQ